MCCGCWLRSETFRGRTGKGVVYKQQEYQNKTESVASKCGEWLMSSTEWRLITVISEYKLYPRVIFSVVSFACPFKFRLSG